MEEFKARFFSKLELSDGEVTLTQEEMHSDRLVRLFFYLIANRDKVCSIADISDAIWGMESDVNISGAVKNLA
ncbi:helix-turn-helix domain-containing protein [Mobilibacterium timonense]